LQTLQKDSITVKQQKNKDNDQGTLSREAKRLKEQNEIDNNEILKILPGFSTYEPPDQQSTKGFIDQVQPNKYRNAMIFIPFYVFCIILNFYSLSHKQNSQEAY
jgi:hypothetical protein